MALPDGQSMMLPLLKLARDNQIHWVRNVADLPTDRLQIADEERRACSSDEISRHGLSNASLLRTNT